ncbi:MAG TPA: class I tRNA ligase family protein [Solirubrobacteraceae bacterium]|jgi:leucyl-tRNA synthetase
MSASNDSKMSGDPGQASNGAHGNARGAHGNNARPYIPAEVETRRQAAWRERDAFRTPSLEQIAQLRDSGDSNGSSGDSNGSSGDDSRGVRAARARYIKPSAPFTSGNVHIGHVRSYSIGDAYARFWRARGDAVLFAFGFDAFGLPAELGAIAAGTSPNAWVQRCAEHMQGQLQRLGFSFDWDRAFMSSDESMYRWSQWLFLTLLEAGLIYRGTGSVDWCDHCQTTLATIQVEDGLCWRCHNPVRLIQRPQWVLRISAYVGENDSRLGDLKDWDEIALASQRYVLGRVDGVEVELSAQDGRKLTAFTPHAEAVSQARFVAISPRHPEIEAWALDEAVRGQLDDLRSGGWERSSRDAESIPVIDTGGVVLSPAGEPLPVLITPSVDSRFGPTIALGVPAADRTDAVIAQRLSLDRVPGPDAREAPTEASTSKPATSEPATSEPATSVASDAWSPRETVRYRAFDFSISRQRSWGTPIPIVYCRSCGTVPISKEQLPVELPLDIKPTGEGNPLAQRRDFVETSCPSCGGPAERETDTLDCHFDALWLWVPVCVPPQHRDETLEQILALPDLRAWLPCERVVAGNDSGNFVFDQRITTKALRDIGPLEFLSDGEPFAGCLFHEMVIRDGRKMSKHLGNVVDPDELVAEYGADTVRLAVLYAARPQRSLNWTDSDVHHCQRFLHQLWDYSQAQFATNREKTALPLAADDVGKQHTEHLRARLEKWCDAALARITADMEALETHSAVRNAMRLFERIQSFEARVLERRQTLCQEDSDVLAAALAMLAQILGPLAPHLAEELWLDSGHGSEGAEPPWPVSSALQPSPGAATLPVGL